MNASRKFGWFITLSLILSGCATTTGLERGDRTTASMQTVENDLQYTLDEIDAVESTLYELIRPGQRDIMSTYERYSAHVDNLDENGSSFIRNYGEMDQQSESYFSEWEKEIENFENPRIQELGRQRHNELKAQYDEIYSMHANAESDLETYIANNREIRTYLSNDLTREGIEAVAPLIEDVIREGQILRNTLTDVQQATESTREAMTRRGRDQP